MSKRHLKVTLALVGGVAGGALLRLFLRSSTADVPISENGSQPSAENLAYDPPDSLKASRLSPTAMTPSTPKIPPPPAAGFDAASQQLVQQIYGLFATGDFGGALEKADQILQGASVPAPVHVWILQQMPALLLSAGWSSLKLGDCETATSLLKRAASLQRSIESSKGLAICYFKQKNLIGAEEQFHAYFELGESEPTMHLLFADLMESESRYDEAVAVLEKLDRELQTAPPSDSMAIQRENLKQRLTSMRGRAKVGQDQRTESTRNFRLSFRSGEHEDLVAWVMSTLEESLDLFVEDYGFKLPPAPIEVLLYPSQDFSSVMVGSPTWAEGLFDGRIRIPVRTSALKRGYETDPDLTIVLRHELVHALFAIMTGGRSLPPWLDEGMAQRLSCPREGCPPFLLPATPGDFLAEPHFLTPFTSFNTTMAGRAYQQGLYLILNIEEMRGDSALREIVTRIAIGGDLSSDAILRAIGLSFGDLHRTSGYRWSKRWIPR